MESKGATLVCVGFMVQRHSKKVSGVVWNLIDRLARTMYVLTPGPHTSITGPLTFILKPLLCSVLFVLFSVSLPLYRWTVFATKHQNNHKHNHHNCCILFFQGSVKGVRYFNCKPKCGLFARAGTVQLAPNNTTAQVRASPAQQRQQHQQYPAPAPAPVQQQPPQQQIQPKQPTHFQIAASAFCFRKDTNQWSELGTGTVRLYTGSDQKVHLDSAGAQTSLNHTVETGTKLEPNVGSDRAWVFRATNAASFAGDVIALQFGDPMAAQRFADAFEDLTIGLETAPAPPAPQAKSNAAPQAPAQQQQQHTTTQASKPPMRQQRRRLSVVGDNVNIDGRRASGFAAQPEEPTILKGHSGVAGTVIGEYSGMSKKGYAPYNGKKENQDVCFMHQDPATNR